MALLTGCSRSEAGRVIAEGHVAISGETTTTRSRRVAAGQTIDIEVDPVREQLVLEADESIRVPVVHEDEDLVVVDKPAGLVVHPGAGTPQSTLAAGLLARYPELAGVGEALRPGIVHRLDRGTSGLLVVARNEPARRDLSDQLAQRRIQRRYLALVWGRFEEGSGVIDAPIGRSDRDRTRMAVTASGREARTRYEVIADFSEPGPLTLLECSLETGRTHQIRVHLAEIAHPVVGDETYGRGRRELDLDRVFLHSARLQLIHPRSREEMVFTSDLPPELESVLANLR